MNDDTEDILILGAVGIGLFVVIKSVLKNFGIDPADTATVQSLNTLDPTQNPFNFLFQPFQDRFNDANTGQSLSDYVIALKAQYDNASPTPVFAAGANTDMNTAVAGELIHDAFSFYKDTNLDGINAIFNETTDQADVAGYDAYLFYNYGDDLETYLSKGKYHLGPINWGLTDTQLAAIINHVNSLPQTT